MALKVFCEYLEIKIYFTNSFTNIIIFYFNHKLIFSQFFQIWENDYLLIYAVSSENDLNCQWNIRIEMHVCIRAQNWYWDIKFYYT